MAAFLVSFFRVTTTSPRFVFSFFSFFFGGGVFYMTVLYGDYLSRKV